MDELLKAFIAYFEEWLEVSDTGKGYLEQVVGDLKALPAVAEPTSPKVPPVIEQWITTAMRGETAPHCEPILKVLQKNWWQLPWGASPANYIGDDYNQGSAYVQLAGPKVHDDRPIPYPSSTVATGLLMLRPGLFYPPHNHKATEFYGILTGLAEWQIYYNRPDFHPPGAHIFHPSEAPHAMLTHDEPLLLIWAWTGELDKPVNMNVDGWL